MADRQEFIFPSILQHDRRFSPTTENDQGAAAGGLSNSLKLYNVASFRIRPQSLVYSFGNFYDQARLQPVRLQPVRRLF
jgi:hypothetical protein